MSIIKAFREESEVIKFDNLFTRDLEDEQQFDLVFSAEQDDEDLKTIAGNKIMRENGEERVFDLPDCVYVNEDGEVKDKDDEVEDISSNDADKDGVDDDIEAAAENPTAAAPSVVVNVDADDVNINAGNGGTSFEGTDDEEVKEDASVTVNAKVVNMTTNVDPANTEENVTPATEPATPPVPAEGPSDDEPIEPIGDIEVNTDTEEVPKEPESSEADVEECGDNCGSTPGTDDNGVPMGEGVEQIMSSSQLEDILNNGLGVAPAYEGNHFINIPEDKSTEVVFSNSNDKEVREAAEPTKDDVLKEEIEAVKNDDNLESSKKIEGEFEDDIAFITDGDIEKEFNKLPEDQTKKDENISPVKPSDVPMNDGSAHEAAEPTIDPPIDAVKEAKEPSKDKIALIEEDIEICCDPTEGEAPCPDCDAKAQPVPGPRKDSSDYNPYGKDPIEDKEDGMETVEDLDLDIETIGFVEAESMDPKEDYVEADAETSLEGIGPGITSGDLEKMYIEKDVDPNRKNTSGIEEAAEPSIDPADYIKEFKEAAEPSIDPADYIKEFKEAAEPSIDPPTDFIKEEDESSDNSNNNSEREADEEVATGPNNSDSNDPAHEAAEPTIDPPIDFITEEIEAVKNDDNLESSKKIEGEFEDDLAPVTDDNVEKEFNKLPEDETKKDEGIDPVKPSDVPMNDGSAHEAAEPTIDPPIDLIKEEDTDILDSEDIDMDNNCDISPIGPTKVIPDEVNAPKGDMNYDKDEALMKEGSDFMDQVNALDSGDSFADTMNTGLNITPEEVVPGSYEELIDDEAIAFIEGE